jgi:catechol-2,3-dioxygenase
VAATTITGVRIEAPDGVATELATFYGEQLGLPVEAADGTVVVRAGTAELTFTAAQDGSEPFYHFAFLVPGDAFERAHAWLGERAELLPAAGGDTVFDFGFWDALGCYVHDPAGNIVELIAHRGIGDGARPAGEILGVSEIGLVTPHPAATVAELERGLGLELWSGEVGDTEGLGFVGSKAHTLIVAGAGRGWLPTGARAAPHPVEVTMEGTADRTAALPEARAIVHTRAPR